MDDHKGKDPQADVFISGLMVMQAAWPERIIRAGWASS